MPSDRSNYVDARGTAISDVGRDQFNIQSYNVYIGLGSVTKRTTERDWNGPPILAMPQVFGGPHWRLAPRCFPEEPFFHRPATYHSTSFPSNNVGTATHLIDEILQSPMVLNFTDQCRDWKGELKVLQITLALADRAIRTYKHTPLGPNLAITIGQETGRCLIHSSWIEVLRWDDGLSRLN
ncbi:hypothetical protein PILCRDRAFT_15625 [Piloderma croceum F 1598]|nr:hypothetical protein PILCRDRAFT_15625 [Piloderma croceum F 1598]